MSDAEVASFLARERTVICATVGPRGWPHLMPLWYVVRDAPAGESSAGPAPAPAASIWSWTYAASQKVLNLERDPRATLLVEAGESYQHLCGVTLECDVIVHRELGTVAALGEEIFRRYSSPRGQPPAEQLDANVAAMVRRQAAKRVGLEFIERHRATWDHSKLGGVY